MSEPIIQIVPYRPEWPAEYRQIAAVLRHAVGDGIVAAHHIGSTAVPGLAAKDIIDIQITVACLGDRSERLIERAGFEPVRPVADHCPPGQSLPAEQLAKWLYKFVGRPANVHVREAGRFNQRYPLLCRDYLRTHKPAADAYAAIKQQLAHRFPNDPEVYYAIKDPTLDLLMVGAEDWALAARWTLPASD
jgi:GrpB-like predicted nucleotidyltransferase (UPF0157 family)